MSPPASRPTARGWAAGLTLLSALYWVSPAAIAQGYSLTCEPVAYQTDGASEAIDSQCSDGSAYAVATDAPTGTIFWAGSYGGGQEVAPKDLWDTLPTRLDPKGDPAPKALWYLFLLPLGCYANHHATIYHLNRTCDARGGVVSLNSGFCGMGGGVTCLRP